MPATNISLLSAPLVTAPVHWARKPVVEISAEKAEAMDRLIAELKAVKASIAPHPIETALVSGQALSGVFEALQNLWRDPTTGAER